MTHNGRIDTSQTKMRAKQALSKLSFYNSADHAANNKTVCHCDIDGVYETHYIRRVK